MAATSSSAAKTLAPYQWKPGQSGNPKGPPVGSRRKFAEEFLADMHEAWQIYGKKVLMKTAKDEPSVFLRVAATLMPRDIEITINLQRAERLSDDELAGYLEAPDRADPVEAQASEKVLQPLGEEM